jgi:hypothetical protein
MAISRIIDRDTNNFFTVNSQLLFGCLDYSKDAIESAGERTAIAWIFPLRPAWHFFAAG